MAKETHDCCATVRVQEGLGCYSEQGCSRRGIVERNGQWYCKQHDPEVAAAKKAAQEAQAERARAVQEARWESQRLVETLVNEAASGTVSLGRLQELALGVQAARERAHELSKAG
jgi:hypothetical protein